MMLVLYWFQNNAFGLLNPVLEVISLLISPLSCMCLTSLKVVAYLLHILLINTRMKRPLLTLSPFSSSSGFKRLGEFKRL